MLIINSLICGDVNGNFHSLFSRVESINKKSGPFDVLLCAGNFFGDDNSQLDAYKMGTRKGMFYSFCIIVIMSDNYTNYPVSN